MDYLSQNLTLLFKIKKIPENVEHNIINFAKPIVINNKLDKDIKNIGIIVSIQKLFNNIGENREKAKQLYLYFIDLEKNNINRVFSYCNYIHYENNFISTLSYLQKIKSRLIDLFCFNNKFYDANDNFFNQDYYEDDSYEEELEKYYDDYYEMRHDPYF